MHAGASVAPGGSTVTASETGGGERKLHLLKPVGQEAAEEVEEWTARGPGAFNSTPAADRVNTVVDGRTSDGVSEGHAPDIDGHAPDIIEVRAAVVSKLLFGSRSLSRVVFRPSHTQQHYH
jgi:hypothetical protein